MSNIEFSIQLSNLDILKVDREAFNHSLCGICGLFIGNGGFDGVMCNGAYSKGDAIMRVPHETRLTMGNIRHIAKCEN